MCYPNYIKVHKFYFVTSLLLARNFLLASLFSFQGAGFQPLSRSDRNTPHLCKMLRFDLVGGDKRNRTAGLLLARQALSQLSYTPSSKQASYHSFPHKCENSFTALFLLSKLNPLRWASIWFGRWLAFWWWAQVDSNHRPHDYQSCALAS